MRSAKSLAERARVLFSLRTFLVFVLPAAAVVYLIAAIRIESPPAELEVSARAFPMLIGVLLIISTAIVAWQELRKPADAEPEPVPADPLADDLENETENEVTSWRDFWLVAGSLVALILLFNVLGFVLAAGTMMFALSSYFDRGHLVRNVVSSYAFAAALFYLFDSVFEIYLPSGLLPW